MLIIVFKGHFDRLSDHRIIVYSIKSYMLIRSQSRKHSRKYVRR